jgi:hypothetical protein
LDTAHEDTEGLEAAQDSLLGWRDLDANRVDVGDSSRWSSALGTPLSAVRLDWRPWAPSSSKLYLVGVHLSFADEQKVTLALAEIADGEIVRSATNIAVIFNDVVVNAGHFTIRQQPWDVQLIEKPRLRRWLLSLPIVQDQGRVEALFEVARRSSTWRM